MQKDADTQDSVVIPEPGSRARGELHELPLNLTTRPEKSTAMQNVDDAQESSENPTVSALTGALHVVPLNVNACPKASTAMQNVVETHETAANRNALATVV